MSKIIREIQEGMPVVVPGPAPEAYARLAAKIEDGRFLLCSGNRPADADQPLHEFSRILRTCVIDSVTFDEGGVVVSAKQAGDDPGETGRATFARILGASGQTVCDLSIWVPGEPEGEIELPTRNFVRDAGILTVSARLSFPRGA